MKRRLRQWLGLEGRRQFVVRLHARDGQYHNFFAYDGIGIDEVLKRARLVERFELGAENCVLIFEELPPA